MGYAGSADIFQAETGNLMATLEYVRAYIDNLLVITKRCGAGQCGLKTLNLLPFKSFLR
jgi:hypothetical protein